MDVAVVAGLDDLETPVAVPVGEDGRREQTLVRDARELPRHAR